jgi:hypothetical protein
MRRFLYDLPHPARSSDTPKAATSEKRMVTNSNWDNGRRLLSHNGSAARLNLRTLHASARHRLHRKNDTTKRSERALGLQLQPLAQCSLLSHDVSRGVSLKAASMSEARLFGKFIFISPH